MWNAATALAQNTSMNMQSGYSHVQLTQNVCVLCVCTHVCVYKSERGSEGEHFAKMIPFS